MLYIITPCSRPENLEQISKTIPKFATWVVLHEPTIKAPKLDNALFIQCPKTGFVGADGRNYFVEKFHLNDEDWIYSLDDDNIIHPSFSLIENMLDDDFSLIYWGQLNKNDSIRLKPLDQIILNTIDTACYVSKWKYNKRARYDTTAYNYDGLYAIECAKNGPILKLNNYLCYYNYLR